VTLALLAVRNWQRRRLRTAVSVLGVAVSIAAAFGLLAFHRGYESGMRAELERLGAHVLVVPKGCPYDAASIALHGAKWPCYLKEDYTAEVAAAGEVAAVAPVLMSARYDPGGRQWVYVGVTPDLLELKPGWRVSGRFPQPGEVLVGSRLAAELGWRGGARVALPGLPDRHAVVSGLLESGGTEEPFLHIPLADAQALFERPGELTHMLVRLRDAERLDAAVAQLRSCGAGGEMNIVPLTHLFRTIQGLTGSARLLLAAIAAVALLIAGAGVGNTMLMAVVERRGEIGVLRALGASRGQVFALFWAEAVLLCLLGGLLGLVLASVGAGVVEQWVRAQLPFAPRGALLRWAAGVALACVGGGLVVGGCTGLLPALRAAALPPSRVMGVT